MNEVKELISRPMTRKEFLQLLGVVLLSIIGVTNLMTLLRSQLGRSASMPSERKVSRGFGTSKFGV